MAIDERTISLCIPNFNRYDLLLDSFLGVLGDDRISEIIISDDASDPAIYDRLQQFAKGIPKIKLFRNAENVDCYENKMISLTYATNPYCILFDSDNSLAKDYIDKLFEIQNWDKSAYLPSFAMPHFDYRKFENKLVTKENIHNFINDVTFQTALNTANYFVDKDFYIKCWDGNINPHTSDSIYMNYLLLNNGGSLYIVPELYYNHRVDDHKDEEKGHYGQNYMKTGNFHNEVLNKLKALR